MEVAHYATGGGRSRRLFTMSQVFRQVRVLRIQGTAFLLKGQGGFGVWTVVLLSETE
tara:strand:+ start:1313 stop:1483 length:171 start_codon:yes stop_codon:yes gene_type:complete